MERYFDIAFSPAAIEHQRRRGSATQYEAAASWPIPPGLGTDEITFLHQRDSLYLASVGHDGWPYLQHRGGPPGFVRVIDPTHLAWADRPGNRQYVSAGNIDGDDRVSLFAMDYPNRRRLKIYGHAHFDPTPDPGHLADLELEGRIEGLVSVEVVAFDWNCPKYITPRYSADDVRAITDPMRQRITELEHELSELQNTNRRHGSDA